MYSKKKSDQKITCVGSRARVMSSVVGSDIDLLDELVEKNREEMKNFKRLALYNQHTTKSSEAATTKLFLNRLHNIRSVRSHFI